MKMVGSYWCGLWGSHSAAWEGLLKKPSFH